MTLDLIQVLEAANNRLHDVGYRDFKVDIIISRSDHTQLQMTLTNDNGTVTGQPADSAIEAVQAFMYAVESDLYGN